LRDGVEYAELSEYSEIKCYGSYILPVLFVFGLLVIGVSLGAVGWKRGWFS
jgi:hypothetical protein